MRRSRSSPDPAATRRRSRSVCSATPRRSIPSWCDEAYGPTSSPTRPRPTIRSTAICPRAGRSSNGRGAGSTIPRRSSGRPDARWPSKSRAMLEFHKSGVPTFDYGNNIRQMAKDEGVADAFSFPGFRAGLHPPAVLPRDRPVPMGRAFRRSGGHLPNRREGESAACPTTSTCTPGSTWPDREIKFQGLPARICWVGLGDRHRLGLAFNEMVASGRAQSADRDRPRPSRFRLGRLAEPRNRSDERRFRRRVGLADSQCAAQLRLGRHVGFVSPRRGCRAWGILSTPAW